MMALRCKLPCGCWIQWVPGIRDGLGHWSFHTDGGWGHTVYSRPRLHDASNPNSASLEMRYLVAAVVASGYGLAALRSRAHRKPLTREC